MNNHDIVQEIVEIVKMGRKSKYSDGAIILTVKNMIGKEYKN